MMAERPIGLLRQLKCLWEKTEALEEGGVGSGQGPKGDKGDPGDDGASAYEVAVANGFQGNEAAWLASLQGADGEPGADGAPGLPGADGADSTVPGPKGDKGDKGDPGDDGVAGADGSDGAPGTPGDDGADGLSAYQVAVANGFVGNEAAWLASLVGPAGQDGQDGADGQQGIQGIQGEPGTGADPWTYVKLANDFTTSSGTAVDITGLAFTPSANLQYEFEACLFMRTATATIGPRPGIAWPGGVTDAVGDAYASASATAEVQAHGNANAALLAANTGLPNTTQSFSGRVYGSVRMGGSPTGTLKIQLASETAGTNVTAKAGSFLKWRAI